MNTHKTKAALAPLAVLAALAGGLLTTAVPAHALEVRKLTGTFGEETFGELNYLPHAVAIDQATGNVYVTTVQRTNSTADVVDVFGAEGGSPAGGVPSQITGDETPGGLLGTSASDVAGVAIDNSCYLQKLGGTTCSVFDPSNGDVYVGSGGTPKAFDKFMLSGSSQYEYLCQFTNVAPCLVNAPAGIRQAGGVAVDASGNVYVGFLGNPRLPAAIVEYNSAGEPLRTTSLGESAQSIALDSAGDIYFAGSAAFASSTGFFEIKRSPSGDFLPTERIPTTTRFQAPSGVAFDPVTGHLFICFDSVAEELNSSNEVISRLFPSGRRNFRGIAVNDETDEIYVGGESDSFGEASAVMRFGPLVVLADVSTGGASRVHHASATIEGLVMPHGLATKYFFQYGETEEYGSSTATTSASVQSAASANLESLEPGRTYHYRLVAENANGANYGADRTFTTPLAVDGVVTGAASGVQATAGVLRGSVEPDGEDALDWFEYGLTAEYGSVTPKVDAGSETEAVPAAATISGLEPNATYHYRLAAENTQGIDYGSDGTFTTLAAPPAFDVTPSVSGVTRAGALVAGAVNPQNSPTTVHVVYVDEAEYAPANSEPYAAGASTAEASVGAGFGDGPVRQPIGGLKPDTTYHYAIVARSKAGTSTSADETFRTESGTPPAANTGGASGVGANAATLSGTIATQGLPTSYGFEIAAGAAAYGPPTGLGSVGAGAGEEVVSLSLSGLLPGVTYRYRITASNVDGTSYGPEQSFTTLAPVGALAAPLSLPLIASPQVAFPSGSEANTAKPSKHKTKARTKKHRRKTRKTAGKRKESKRTRKG